MISILNHMKLCRAIPIHKFKRVEITHIYLISDQTYANIDV